MNYFNSLTKAIEYIENNLSSNLDIDTIAKQAGFSSFYFQRIFNILCGYSVGQYIRYRRLTLAAADLKNENAKVIDIALKYGYESPESFTRAFVKFHGITPSEARKSKSSLKSFSRLCIEIHLKGGSVMNYKIIKTDAFKVLEKVSKQSIDDSQNKNTIPAFWDECHKDGTVAKLLSLAESREFIFGICYGGDLTDKKTFDYSIAAQCDDNTEVPDGFRINEIPARTWAVFECTGPMPHAIQETWHKICAEFFPNADYEPTYELDIEAYTAGDMTAPDYKSQIWVPIKS